MKRNLNVATILAEFGTLSLLMCAGVLPAQAASYNISMTAYGFSPAYLEVNVGDRVYWWNDDDDFYDPHSTRSYSYPWNSGAVSFGYGVYLDMTRTGSYDYVDDVGYSGWGTLVVKSGPPPATMITAPNRVDMVYDAARDILYITSGSSVLRYQLSTDSFLSPYQLSGTLMGIDLSPDGNTLMIADASATLTNVWVHLIDLNTGQTNRAAFPKAGGESGIFGVAFGGDGAALISSRYGGSGWVPLRRYDLVSGSTTVIGSVRQDSMVSSSGDGSTIIIAESNSSGGEMDLYDVASRAIVKTGRTGHFNYECAASRDGALLALPTYYGTLVYSRTFNQVTNIGVYAGEQPICAVFHPAADVVFFPFAGTRYMRAYDTTTWTILAQYDFQNTFIAPSNHAFTNGRMRISPDGEIIFVTVSGGVRYLRHGLSVPLTHRLVVAGDPKPYGDVTPMSSGTYWLQHGSWVSLSAPAYVQTNETAFICAGWTGTGSAAGSGTTTDAGFTLTANSTLTWNWTPLAVTASLESQPDGQQIVLHWPSIAGKTYDLLGATNLRTAFTPVATDLADTPPCNTYQEAIGTGRAGFYRVQVK